jgi:single-strand DNA-binding protein
MINNAQVLGRVGKIETKTLPTGMKATNISMVTTKKYTKDGEKHEKSVWHNIAIYHKMAEVAEKYVNVGDLLFIQGEMDSSTFKGQDGVERIKFKINATDMKFIPRQKDYKSENVSNQPKKVVDQDPFEDCQIPF